MLDSRITAQRRFLRTPFFLIVVLFGVPFRTADPLGLFQPAHPSRFSTDGHHERMHRAHFSTAFHNKKPDSCDEQPLLRNLKDAH
jgi:hypothetical protein